MVQRVYERIMKVLGNEEPSSLSEDYILELINEAQRRLALYSSRTKTSEVFMIPGDVEAELPPDLLSIVTVYWRHNQDKKELRSGAGAPPLDLEFQEEIDDKGEGTPQLYYVKHEKLLIQPSPSVESQLYIVYNESPSQITEVSDRLAFESSEHFIFYQAVYQYFMDNGEEYRANQWKPRRDESLMEWIENSENQNYAQPIIMKLRW